MATKLDLREDLNLPSSELTSEIEKFQNQCLRPILKFQNEVYVALFDLYAIKQKMELATITREKRRLFIEQSLQKDVALKNMMIGITIGLLSNTEIKTYVAESKELNRRIITMVIKRLESNYKI